MPGRFSSSFLRFAGVLAICAPIAATPVAHAAAAPGAVELKVEKKRAGTREAARRAAEVRAPTVRVQDEGALGYDWSEWRHLAGSRDVRLRWRLGVAAAGAGLSAPMATARHAGASLSELFEEERARTHFMITDTPLHRDGILTVALRMEF